MSRSRRKTKIFGSTTARSEKSDKVIYHRRLRRRVAIALRKGSSTGEEHDTFPVREDVSNVWRWAKDGKGYWADASDKDMRK